MSDKGLTAATEEAQAALEDATCCDGKMADKLRHLRDKLNDQLSHLGDRAKTVGRKAKEGYVKTEECIQHHPMSSVLLALGVGVAIGLAIGLTRRRHGD